MNEEKRMKILQLVTAAAVLLFVLLSVALVINLVKLAGTSARRKALEAELAALDRRIEQNDALIDYRQTEAYIDAYAREYLNMIGAGETAFTGK